MITLQITLTDIEGRIIHSLEGDYDAGRNEVIIKRRDLGAVSGVLMYEVDYGDDKVVKRMILVE